MKNYKMICSRNTTNYTDFEIKCSRNTIVISEFTDYTFIMVVSYNPQISKSIIDVKITIMMLCSKNMTRAWTVHGRANQEGTFDFSQNSIKTPSGDFKQVSEEF